MTLQRGAFRELVETRSSASRVSASSAVTLHWGCSTARAVSRRRPLQFRLLPDEHNRSLRQIRNFDTDDHSTTESYPHRGEFSPRLAADVTGCGKGDFLSIVRFHEITARNIFTSQCSR